MVLNEEQWIKELREKRIAYGISQGRLAVASGITREYLNKIESGKMKPSKELLETLHKELARFNPEAPLTMLFDYVKIRFPTLDIQHIIKDILKLNINYMLHEDYGHYSYTEHYSLPFPVTFTQITWFVITEFIIILFGDIPPLSMIEGAFLKYFGIPVALTWFMSQKTFDGKKPYSFLKSQTTYALRPKITYAGKAVKLHKQTLNETITAVRSVNYVPDKIY